MDQLIKDIWTALRTVQDPELGFSIVELGLVYGVEQTSEQAIKITMTLTSPMCPLQDHFHQAIGEALQPVIGSRAWHLEFTLTPPWSLTKAELAVQQHFALLGIPLSRF